LVINVIKTLQNSKKVITKHIFQPEKHNHADMGFLWVNKVLYDVVRKHPRSLKRRIRMDYLKVLKDIISIDTTVPPGRNYAQAIQYLEPLFKEVGFQTRVVDIPTEHAEGREGRMNLICDRKSAGKPRLIFYAHIDVVPAQGWDAFNPRVENGKVYGRGAADMKGAIPALLLALDRVKNLPLRYDTSVIITTDEESSQASQLRFISQYLQPLKGAYFFDLDCSFGFVNIASLGALHLEILVKGKSVHSGLSHLGVNAVEKSILILNALMDLKAKVTQKKSAVRTSSETGLDHMVPRLNINMIQGGLKVNIVPDSCVISVDRRLIPEENVADARKEILDTLSSVKGVDWEIQSETRIPTLPPCDDEVTDKLAAILKEVTGQGGKFGEMGSGDLPCIVVNEWGGKEFGMGVIRTESNIHGMNEFVYQKDIENLSEIIYRFIS
jgi:succinyl-diaminopimelate desuccinylase